MAPRIRVRAYHSKPPWSTPRVTASQSPTIAAASRSSTRTLHGSFRLNPSAICFAIGRYWAKSRSGDICYSFRDSGIPRS